MGSKYRIIALAVVMAAMGYVDLKASSPGGGGGDSAGDKINPKEIIFEHIRDAYWWHITTIREQHVSIYLPVIVYSPDSGLHIFSSSRVDHGNRYRGFYISGEGRYAGKIVKLNAVGEEVRPLDLSITKIALAIIINSTIMLILFLFVARRYKRKPKHSVPGGFPGAVEMLVMSVEDDIIRKSIGKDYARYSPYLLTAFFFIFINNLMGLIPFFPGGANVTGNISVTLVLALCTMLAINVFGNKEYRKEIFWPDVPLWMKVPLPLMPVIELFGVISKPFALTIRLFANITAGHAVILALTCLVFITAKMGVVMNTGMTVFSVILSVFMSFLEILVAYIQAYVFTMLSAVFIGLSRLENHHGRETDNGKTDPVETI
ncbi:MAG: F0F1 ATP synthase subunit A [Tannerella sp.]|jgi:F-type H+-transporting ATPase subunit a|nr:F0F1 ATP synthase subunit A [Tannerella sp.]